MDYLAESTFQTFSRAIGDDEIENNLKSESIREVSVKLSPIAQEEICSVAGRKIKCRVLIIALGPEARGFVQTCVLAERELENLAVICSGLSETDSNSFSQEAATDKGCYVKRLKERPEFLTVLCSTPDVSPEQQFNWCDQLFSSIDVTNETFVCVLTTAQASAFKTEVVYGDLCCPFIRSLNSSAFRDAPVCPCLEQPSTVGGLPAQVLLFCETHQLPGVLYVCYTDMRHVDFKTMKAFQAVLKSSAVKDFVVPDPNTDAQLLAYAEQHATHSTLYL